MSFTAQQIRDYRAAHPGIVDLAFAPVPNARRSGSRADFAGSTAAMIGYVGSHKPQRVVITECSVSDNVAVEHPEVDFVRPCFMPSTWPHHPGWHTAFAADHDHRSDRGRTADIAARESDRSRMLTLAVKA
ncbi:MAG: quinolinate synthase NadA [Alphaproteobacteria bacterium]